VRSKRKEVRPMASCQSDSRRVRPTSAAAAVSRLPVPPAASGRKRNVSRSYQIHSGRRVVKTVLSSSPLQAAIDYVHTFGSAKEITILGPNTVSWRGARFVGVPVPDRSPEAEPPVSPA